MTQLRALIFDVDGTLADTERDGHRVAFNRAFAAAGLDWHWAEELYGQLLEVAGGKERIQHYVEKYLPDFQPPGDLKTFAAGLHRLKTDHYRELLAEGTIPLRPGVKRLIVEARKRGILLAIATTSAPDNVTALLKQTLGEESPSWFSTIAAGDMVAAKKPAPDVYHYVLRALNLQPDECLVIEDSQQGLIAARSAGLKTVVTVNPYTQTQKLTGALLVLDHLGEPDLPFKILSGAKIEGSYLNISLAQHLCQLE